MFYKQPVYKQLALRWQIAKQLSGLNLLALSNDKNYKLQKTGVFPAAVKPTLQQNSAFSKHGDIYLHAPKHYRENFKITDHKFLFWILKIIVFLADIGYLVKLLSIHEATLSPENLENITNFDGLKPDPNCLWKRKISWSKTKIFKLKMPKSM